MTWDEDDLLLRWDRLRGPPVAGQAMRVDPERDAAAILYTAGTTGQPRGALLSHANLAANAAQLTMWFTRADPGSERLVAVLPFFHAFGLSAVLLFGIALGAELVLLPRFEPKGFLRMLRRKQPTFLAAVPTLLATICELPGADAADFASLKVCVSGGDALPDQSSDTLRGADRGPADAGLRPHRVRARCHLRQPACGLRPPRARSACRCREPRSRSAAATNCLWLVGQIGEICVRGPQVMLGYAGRRRETLATVTDGWLRTGDLGRVDAEGFLWIVGRLKDIIVTSGYKTYPRRIEDALETHSAPSPKPR